MIAINVLKDAQAKIFAQTGRRPIIRCFFSEKDPEAYKQLTAAIAPFNKPEEGFEIMTYCGEFEDAVPAIKAFVGDFFPLIFIDPTGWTGYAFERIKSLFVRSRCEVLINFMYDFINRAASMSDPKTIASLNPIRGGPNWEQRLDPSLPRGRAVEKLFRDTLREVGGFEFVVSTKIDRATVDRPHFAIAYGTKSREGLKAFRETEYTALRSHARNRAIAKERKRERKTGSFDLFPGLDSAAQESTIEDIVEEQKALGSEHLVSALRKYGWLTFADIVTMLLEAYMLRETDVRDICVDLAKGNVIERTWGGGNRKPRDQDIIKLKHT